MIFLSMSQTGYANYLKDDDVKSFKRYITEEECQEYSPKEIKDLEIFADRLLRNFDIDMEFTRHLLIVTGKRLNDFTSSSFK